MSLHISGTLNSDQGIADIKLKDPAVTMSVMAKDTTPSSEWGKSGAYILLYPYSKQQVRQLYIGESNNLRTRKDQHVKGKLGWTRAVLIRSESNYKFHSTRREYLQYRLYEELSSMNNIEMTNNQQPKDPDTDEEDRQWLDRVTEAVIEVMFLLGYDLQKNVESPNDQVEELEPENGDDDSNNTQDINKEKRKYNLSDIIRLGLLKPESTIVSASKKYPAEATIKSDGSINYEGQNYKSPSTVAGRIKVAFGAEDKANGWTFWNAQYEGEWLTLDKFREMCVRNISEGQSSIPKIVDKPKRVVKRPQKRAAKKPVKRQNIVDDTVRKYRANHKLISLINREITQAGVSLWDPKNTQHAILTEGGTVMYDGKEMSINEAAELISGKKKNAWTYFGIVEGGQWKSLADIRDENKEGDGK